MRTCLWAVCGVSLTPSIRIIMESKENQIKISWSRRAKLYNYIYIDLFVYNIIITCLYTSTMELSK